MKPWKLAAACLLINALPANAQNLVPNPSFENYTFCPENYYEEVALAVGWMPYIGSSDYAHRCAWTVPNTPGGSNQEAHTGDAYVGFLTYISAMNGNHREAVTAELTEPMVVGQEYFVSMYVVRSDAPQAGATNNIGALFSTVPFVTTDPYAPLPNFAHVYSNTLIMNDTSWTRIAGSFIADSAYRYLAIGNFFDSTNTVRYGDFCYYFVDDISVSTDAATGIDESNTVAVSVYPNPAPEEVTLSFEQPANELYSLVLYDIHGRQVQLLEGLSGNGITLPRNDRESGVYFFQLRTANGGMANGKIVFE